MSFILDALRKSEHERQRQSGPALVETPVAAPKPRVNRWATAAVVLLLVNLLAVGGLLLWKARDPAGTAPGAAAPTATGGAPIPAPGTAATASSPAAAQASVTRMAPEAPVGTQPAAPPPMLRPAEPPTAAAGRNPLADEVGGDAVALQDEMTASASAPPPGPPAVVATPGKRGSVVYQTLTDTDPVTSTASAASAATRDLPGADEVAARNGLPELRLELHVYANSPQERFVFINGRRYREGETTAEGAAVEQITPAGVVMNLQGTRFLLSRD
jgi:general secretion pathway protein B